MVMVGGTSYCGSRFLYQTGVCKFFFISPGDGVELVDGKNRRNNLRLQESQPKSLAIEVVSSQSKVSVSVDGTTVSHSNDTGVVLSLMLKYNSDISLSI
jgi:hypothetical protein